MADSPREPQTAGLLARLRPVAQRRVLWGASCVGDLVLAAAVAVVAVVAAEEHLLSVNQGRRLVLPGVTYTLPLPAGVHPPPVTHWELLAIVLATVPLAFRRTYAASAFGVILVAFIATSGQSTAITVGAVIFAAYSAIAYSRYRGATLVMLLSGAVIITVAYPGSTGQLPERYTPLLVLLPTASLGYLMRMWRERAAESAERLGLERAAHEAETRRAVETERARIASDLHDVVTHNVSVMVVQAGGARVADNVPDDVREALQAIEVSGRDAMTELRHLLGLLAPAGPSAGTGAVGQTVAADDDDATLRPQPGLDQVPALVARVRAAGLSAELCVVGTPRDLPRGPDLAAYRVIQEALTNVIKHADRAKTTVRIEYRPRDLLVDVANDAPVPVGGRPAGPGGAGGGSGRGLIGLRERVTLYRGSLDAGPRPGGGWRLRATIPLDNDDDAPQDMPDPAGLRGART